MTTRHNTWYNIRFRGRPGKLEDGFGEMAMDRESWKYLARRVVARMVAGLVGVIVGLIVLFINGWLALQAGFDTNTAQPFLLIGFALSCYLWAQLQWVAKRLTPYDMERALFPAQRPTFLSGARKFLRDATAPLRAGRSRRH